MSNQKATQQIALLTFGGDVLLPTVLLRMEPFDQSRGLLYDRFALPVEAKREDAQNVYRQFKADLFRTDGELGREDRDEWGMIDRRATDGRIAEVYWRPAGQKPQYFSALQATEVFLYRLCREAVRRARELFPEARKVRVHFTVPAADSRATGEAGAREASDRYRAHLREAIERFKDAPEFAGTEFRLVSGSRGKGWLYEPYGVYYYYATFAGKVPLRESRATYLIVDMGGSTTDLSVVQVNQKGSEFVKYPLCESIRIGGADFDQFVLGKLSGRRAVALDRDEALDRVERAKIAVSESGASATVELNGATHVISPESLATWLRQFWTRRDGGSLREGLDAFVETVRATCQSNPLFHEFDSFSKVFLAGGSIQLPGFKELLRAELGRLGLVGDASEVFESPEDDTRPSSVTALGLAAEIARVDQLDRASAVYAQFVDDKGRDVHFPLRSLPAPKRENGSETVLFSRELHGEAAPARRQLGRTITPEYAYEAAVYDDVVLPEYIDVRYRNDLEDDYQSGQRLEVKDGGRILSSRRAAFLLKNQVEVVKDDSGVRVKPMLFWKVPGDDQRPTRFKKDVGRHTVSLKPGAEDGDVHLCIDFGMSNTSVAVFSPGRPVPAGSGLVVLTASPPGTAVKVAKLYRVPDEVGNGRGGRPAAAASGEPVSSAGEEQRPDSRGTPVRDPGPAREGAAPEPGAEGSAGWGQDLEGLEDRVYRRMIGELLGRFDAVVAAASSRGVEEAVGPALHRIADAFSVLSEHLALANGRTLREAEAAPDPVDAVERELADPAHPLARGATEGDLLARSAEADGRVADALVERLEAFIRNHHADLHYERAVLRSVLAACESGRNRLVILAGPPGTGKSTLVRILAEFYNQTLDDREVEAVYLLQPVSPSWFSPASLQGSYSEIDGRFHGTPFLRQLLRADLHQRKFPGHAARRFFVCLDEFNVAQPEQYLAEILSRMEARPDTAEAVLAVCRAEAVPALRRDIEVRLTPNLKLFATVNVDASTHLLSPKVLDRSQLIRLTPSLEALRQVASVLAKKHRVPWFHRPFSDLLETVHGLGRDARSPLGYRALTHAYEYASGRHGGSSQAVQVIDEVLCNVMLIRLPGLFVVNTGEYQRSLEAAMARFRDDGYTGAAELAARIAEGVPGQVA